MTKLLAVIHHLDDATTMRNAAIAADSGFDGVLLIEMEGRDFLLDPVAPLVKAAQPTLIVGTNRLSVGPVEGIRAAVSAGLDAAWSDDPGLRSDQPSPLPDRVDAALAEAREVVPGFLFFGSVAFKTQRRDPDPEAVARLACARGWIATTSGPATGFAPKVEKLEAMRRGAGAGQLAVASGVSPDNGAEIGRLVDWVLVATGVSADFHNLDPELCRRLRLACPA
jgi:hypothetical protein